MRIKLKSINLTNYKGKGTWDFRAEFGDMTKISGRNKSGKSSVMDAYLDCITEKLADGSEPNSVRPHDENGNDLNRDDVVRELVFDIDGTETTVKKITSQKWVKKSGTTEEVFNGNKTTYVIDGFESSNQKAFTEWQEKIAKADVLLMCSNARPFLNVVQKSTAEARKILENLAGFSTEKFIAENPKYAHIAEITKNRKIEEVLKQLRRDLNVQKKAANEAKVKLDYERAREISVDGGIEIAELELAINELKEQIAELDKHEAILDEAVKAYDEASSGVLELKFKLSGLQQEANADLEKKRRQIQGEIDDVERQSKKVKHQIRLNKQDIQRAEESIQRNTKLIYQKKDEWEVESKRLSAEQERVFDENSLVCSYCGQEYPEDKKEQLRAEFERRKEDEIKKIEQKIQDINKSGSELKATIKKDKEEIEQLKATLKENEDEEINLAESVKGLTASLGELSDSIDISDTEEYKAIQSQIAEKEATLNAMNNNSEKRAEIKEKRQQLLDEIAEKKAIILKYQKDEEQKEYNVSLLEEDLRNKNQSVADVEQRIDLLKGFSIEKNQQLAKEINPFFRHFQFDFVEFTQEGNPVETLKLMCGGTDYFSGLNLSDRILCEIDLVCGLQRLNLLNLPIFVDNTEAINTDRLNDFIKDLPQQIILLEKTEDEKLKVEVVS